MVERKFTWYKEVFENVHMSRKKIIFETNELDIRDEEGGLANQSNLN